MTETQTPCATCGDTGFVPPFMDPCTACTAVPLLDKSWICDKGSDHPGDQMVCSCTDADEELADEFDAAADDLPDVAALAGDPGPVMPTEAEMDEYLGAVANEAMVAAALAGEPPFAAVPDYAAGYGEAGIYSDPSISYGPAKTAKPITDAQKALLAKLITERDATNSFVWNAKARLDSGVLTAKSASRVIDDLMKIPADPAKKAPRTNNYDGTCATCKGPVPAGTGRIEKAATGRWVTFHLDGKCLTVAEIAVLDADKVVEPGLYKHDTDGTLTIYRVRKARMSDRLYAEKVCTYPDGAVAFAYNANAMSFLRASNKLTWQEARSFGAAYGACVACGRTLSDPRSLVQGYGPTCGSKYHWPLVTLKQAEAVIEGILTWEEAASLV